MVARFNVPATVETRTENFAGGEAFVESPKLELVSMLLTSMVQDQFYRSADAGLKRLSELLNAVDPLFAAKAAVYARREFGLRSITHALAAELALRVRGATWTRGFYEAVVVRPDDITEILSYLQARHGIKPGRAPNALRDGLARAFGKFDGYALGKYRAEGKGIALVDAVNVLHPRPTERNAEALAGLVKGTLRQTDTWEDRLTAAGDAEDVGAAKAGAWRELLVERKLGYFALLRNLRNISQQAPELIPLAAEQLVDRDAIRESRVLPFRFLTAAEALSEVPGTRELLAAVAQALDIAVANVPRFEGKSLVVLDESGSMTSLIRRGQPAPLKLGAVFAAALYKANDADLMLFSTDARFVNIDPTVGAVGFVNWMLQHAVAAGTNFRAIFQKATAAYDRIFILSDMQGWVGHSVPTDTLEEYRRRTGANPHIYSIDLQGYGTLQLPEPRVHALAGFSEKLFDVMALLEGDRNALMARIDAVTF